MNEFDDLLNEVLRQDGNQQLPSDMRKRIIAALPPQRTRFSGRWAIWVGTAAAILVAVVAGATWTRVRTRNPLPVAPTSGQVSLKRPGNLPKLVESHRRGFPQSGQNPAGRRLMSHASIAIHPRLPLQQRAICIEPVNIEALVIKPIEIASVIPSGSTMKGKIR
jgi:hypothetical protein